MSRSCDPMNESVFIDFGIQFPLVVFHFVFPESTDRTHECKTESIEIYFPAPAFYIRVAVLWVGLFHPTLSEAFGCFGLAVHI